MSVTPQIWPMRYTFLQSLAPTLIKLTHLWFSNDLEDTRGWVWLRLELNSSGKWILWVRFEDPWPIWSIRFWKGVFWFESFQFNWVTKKWPVNVNIFLFITGLPTQNLHGPKGTKVALGRTGWPTLGHHGINVGSLIVRAAHREPTVSPKLDMWKQLVYQEPSTGAGHIIRISSKSWFISLIPFKKWNLYNVYIHSTQTDIFQVFISFNFDDYNWQLMKTPNSVSQKIRILLKTNTKKGFLEILANGKVWTWKVWACTALNT